MTTSELLNLSSVEISKLKKPQLRKIVQTLASTSNKRLKRLQQKGISTPASRYVNKSGKFSTKGKNINQLRAEYIRAKNFLQSKTSTLKGYKQFKKEVQMIYEPAGYPVCFTDYHDFEGEGHKKLFHLLSGKVTAFAGPSGWKINAGKSFLSGSRDGYWRSQ